MRKWLIGLAAFAAAGAIAQTAYNAPGGIPSRLTLQALNVSNFFKCALTGVSGRQCDVVGNGTGATAVAYVGFVDQSGARYGYFGKSSSGSTINYESDAAVQVVANNGTDSLGIDTSHNLSYNGVSVTPSSGTFTLQYGGMTTVVSCTATWTKVGNIATLTLCAATGTSNATSMNGTTLPAAIIPATLSQRVAIASSAPEDAGGTGLTSTIDVTITAASSTLNFNKGGTATGWTASGTKGFFNPATITYLLN